MLDAFGKINGVHPVFSYEKLGRRRVSNGAYRVKIQDINDLPYS